MDIATAKPTLAERAGVPHHGLDLVDPDQPFSVADYRRLADEALAGIADRAGLALLVGGTGLYLRAVASGLPLDGRGSDPALRSGIEARLVGQGLASLVAELCRRDPRARDGIDLHNPRRVVRALERVILTGSAVPPPPTGYPAPVTWLGLDRPREEHGRVITARVEEQFQAGLLEEAAGLRSRYPEPLRAFSAVGYREAFDVLDGRATASEAMARVASRTRAYARRQRTWFRAEPGISWLGAGEGAADAARRVLAPWLRTLGPAVYAGLR
jgi:tRNA dimethylallyltransferase